MPSFAASSTRSSTLPLAHHEHMDDRAGRSHVEAERIAIAHADRRDLLLAIAQRLNGPRGIAQMRRFLEPLGGGGLGHRARQPIDQLVVLPFEEQLRALHGLVVLLLRADRGHARRDASLDVVLEARPLAVSGDHLVARSDAEQPVRQPHRPARERRRHERAGIVRAVALDAARDEHARKRLVRRQLQVG